MKPVLIVTSDIPPDRVAPLRALHERMPITVARFGGERRHAAAGIEDPGVPVLDVAEREVSWLVRDGQWSAVVAGTVGRVALPAAYLAARRARLPFVLWSALWSQPHALSAPLMLWLYRNADAVAAYGEHVAAYASARGAREVVIAPQAVDPAFWGTRTAERPDRLAALFVGRLDTEKGVHVLLDAWRASGLKPPAATLTFVGGRITSRWRGHHVRRSPPFRGGPQLPRGGHRCGRTLDQYQGVPRALGLVANEAMHQQLPVIATDAVGAVAGGLVRHERNGLVVPSGDTAELAAALRRLAGDPTLRAKLGENAARDVAAFTPEAWAAGMARAVEVATR